MSGASSLLPGDRFEAGGEWYRVDVAREDARWLVARVDSGDWAVCRVFGDGQPPEPVIWYGRGAKATAERDMAGRR